MVLLFRAIQKRSLLSLFFRSRAAANMATLTTKEIPYKVEPWRCTHNSWPYKPQDFLRADESPDTKFYSSSRLVTHIDDNAISHLRNYYAHKLPKSGRVLDFCSSWISHYPRDLEERAQRTIKGVLKSEASRFEEPLEVIGAGMNQRELDENPILASRIVQDLNTNPVLPPSVKDLDAATCVVSIDYITKPRKFLEDLRGRMKPEGNVHLVISNRCFPSKVVGRWLRIGERERLNMVGDYLHFAGWKGIEIVTLCEGGWGVDPLWVVTGGSE
jgi:hypothetical protein